MNCWLLENTPSPKIAVGYIAVTNGSLIDSYAQRFVQTYIENDAGYPHRVVVICNGGKLAPHRKNYFNRIKNVEFLERPNDEGFDISAYQHLAEIELRNGTADFLMCFGESIYFHRPGWLERIASARMEHGSGMYGCFSSHYIRAHLNTTGFGADARLIAKYPPVRNHPQRYGFEHGYNCFWKRLYVGGNKAVLVTFDGEYFPGQWRDGPNIMHRDRQDNCLCFCNHTEKWQVANPSTKALWTAQSDSKFSL